MDEIFTVFQASKHCNVSPKTIINWIEAGHIQAYKTVGGHRRIKKSDMEEYDYEIISASDGFEAGLQVNHFRPHLLILDIMMPDIKGYDVCKKIKTNEETKDTKILVLSAYLDDEKFKKMKEYGADLCFSKPLPLPQLKKEVAKMLGVL